MTSRRVLPIIAMAALLAVGCGSSSSGSASSTGSSAPKSAPPESSPPGDIPDNQAFVRFAPPRAAYTVAVPEGWARTTAGGAVSFTDKLNTVRLEQARAASLPTVAEVRRTVVPRLARTATDFKSGTVTSVHRDAGPAIRITYLARGAADPVTGKARLDAVERYLFVHRGHEAVLTLSGPKGADNVDPWRTITDSLRWSR
jgi:hypothetical protein